MADKEPKAKKNPLVVDVDKAKFVHPESSKVSERGKAAAKGKAEKPAAKGETLRASAIADDKKIVIVSKENPYREGTKAFATFALMEKTKEVGKFRAACNENHDANYVRYALRDGYIKLA